jgi:hypothetical protein
MELADLADYSNTLQAVWELMATMFSKLLHLIN